MSANSKWISGLSNRYTTGTFENNWNEERFDLKYLKNSTPLSSQHGHAYQTSYNNSNNFISNSKETVHSPQYRVVAYPSHQPEIDPEQNKRRLNTYETDYRINYLNPDLKKIPFDLRKMVVQEIEKHKSESIEQITSPTGKATN